MNNDYFRSWWRRYSWSITALIFLVLSWCAISALNGCIGAECTWLSDNPKSWLDSVFFTLQMLVMNYGGIHGADAPLKIQLARFGLPLLASFAVIKGLMEVLAYRHLSFRILAWRDHIVFCGCGDQARALIWQYIGQGTHKRIVVVDINDSPENKKLEDKGVLFLKEDATLPDVLRQVRVKQARCVYLMAGADRTNMGIFETFEKVISTDSVKSTGASLKKCFIHLYDNTLKSAIDARLADERNNGANQGWEVLTFNTWANSARALIAGEQGPHLHCKDTFQPHILVLGHGRFAEQIITQGARLGHYSGGRKLRVTYIDENANEVRDRLYAQHPVLDPNQAAHMAWHPKERGYLPVIDTCFIAHPAECLTGELYAKVIEPTPLSVAYICHPEDEKALSILAALMANTAVPNNVIKPQLVLCDMHGHHKDCLVNNSNPQVVCFDAIAAGISLKQEEDVINGYRETWAKSIHEFFRKKYHQKTWNELSEDMRDSNRQSADHWKIKLDWIKSQSQGDFNAALKNHRDELMRFEHERWCAERFMSGWRYCDNPITEDAQKSAKSQRLNWCLCPYEELGEDDKQKDADVCDIAAELYSKYKGPLS